MMKGDEILAQVQQGTAPQNWQVFRGRPSHFYKTALLYVFALVVLAAILVYLVTNPNQVFALDLAVSNGGTLDAGSFALWRSIDFALIAILGVSFAAYVVYVLVQSTHAKEHLLVLLPEGFVINIGHIRSFPFANLTALSAVSSRWAVTIRMLANDGRPLRVRLDGRFGNYKQVAQTILTTRSQFLAAAARKPDARGA